MKKKCIVILVQILLFSLLLVSCSQSETRRENQSGKEIIYMYNSGGKYAIVNNKNSIEKKIVSSGFITAYYFDNRHDLYIVTGASSNGFTFKVKGIDFDTWEEKVIEGDFEQPVSLYSDGHYLYVLDAREGIKGMLHIFDLNTKEEEYRYSFAGFASLVKKYKNTLFILSDDLQTNQHYMYVFEEFNIKDVSVPQIFKLKAGLATDLIGNGNEVYIALQSNAEMSGKGNLIAVYHIGKENVTYINLKNPSPYKLILTEDGQLLSANYDFVTQAAFNAERIDIQTKGTEVLDFKTNSIHLVGDKIAYFNPKSKAIILDGEPVLHTEVQNITDFFILP